MKTISPKRLLLTSLIIAIVNVISVEFVFTDVPELFDGGARLGDLVTGISLSYIAAYFFYLATFVAPNRIRRKHIEEHAAHLIDLVLFYILFVLQDSTNFNISQKDLKITPLTIDDFKKATTDVYMDDELARFRHGANGHNMQVGEAVSKNLRGVELTANDLLRFSLQLEPELISLLTATLRNKMFQSWPNSYYTRPSYIGGQTLTPVRKDVSWSSELLYDFHLLYKEIEEILISNYSDTETAKKYVSHVKSIKSDNNAKI